MKKLLLLLFLYSSVSYAQIDFTRVYHPIINEAEIAIVDTNYHEALSFYNEAFANVEKPFVKDYYNAAVCAALVGKMPVVFDFLEKIVAKGYEVENFRKDKFFKSLADTSKQWKDFENRALLIKPSVNTAIRDSLWNLYQLMVAPPGAPLSQELRTYYKKNPDLPKWRPVDSLIVLNNMPSHLLSQIDSIRKINDRKTAVTVRTNLLQLQRLLDMHGFIDENMIGLNQLAQPGLAGVPRTSTSPFFLYESSIVKDILLLSSFQRHVEGINIQPIIKQAIREGKAHPFILNSLLQYSTDEPYTMGRVSVVQLRLEDNISCSDNSWEEKKEKFYWKKEKSATLSEIEINEKRQNVGLEKIEDAYRKAFFKARPTPFLIYSGSYQPELAYISSCDLIDKMIKGTVVVK